MIDLKSDQEMYLSEGSSNTSISLYATYVAVPSKFVPTKFVDL